MAVGDGVYLERLRDGLRYGFCLSFLQFLYGHCTTQEESSRFRDSYHCVNGEW